ncbi:alt surface [Tibetan frog hepatitis B virus]|nr:alt surface [Tibetan frog hepatitis B virus]ANN02858.1 alt surface [Tibetan frog hepatitis B virus]
MRFFARVWSWIGGNPSQHVSAQEHRDRMEDPHAFQQYLATLPDINRAALLSLNKHFRLDNHQGFLQILDNATFAEIAEHYYRFRQAYANHSITWTPPHEEEYWEEHALYPEKAAPVEPIIPVPGPKRAPPLKPRPQPRNRTKLRKPSDAIPVLLAIPTSSSTEVGRLPYQIYPHELLPIPKLEEKSTTANMSGAVSPALWFPVVALVVYFLLTKAREILAKLDWWWTSHSFRGANGECIFQDTSPQTQKHLAGFCPLTCGGFLWTSLRLFTICLIILLAVCGYLFLMEKGFTSLGEQLWELGSAPGTLLSSLLSSLKGSGNIFLSIALLTWMTSSYLTLTPATSLLLLTGLWATYNNMGSG